MLKKFIIFIFIIFFNFSITYANNIELIKVQSGLEKVDFLTYKCKKESCKINLIVEGFTDKNYSCLWDFGGGIFKIKDTDKKCNPGYVDYETGEFKVNLKIYKKDDLKNILKQETIKIINFKKDSLKLYSDEASLSKILDYNQILPESIIGELKQEKKDKEINNQEKEKIFPEIIIQSGLDYLTGNIYKCKNKNCKINLTSSGFTDKNYSCLWDFGGGTFKTKDTYKKCNPGYVDYETGEFKISLKVSNKKDNSIFYKKEIFIKNLVNNDNEIKNLNLVQNIDSNKQKNNKPKAIIKLQGRLAKYKKLSGNKLICNEINKCSVNLTGEDSIDEDKKDLKYFWDFGNGYKFNGKNPKSIYFEKGDYKISLKVVDKYGLTDIDYFYVKVIPKGVILEKDLDKNIFGNLKIYGVLPNISGRDDKEFIEIENKSNYKLNLKGLIISDATKKYKIENNLYLYPYSKKRFYKHITKLSLGNKKDLVRLVYNNVILDELKWDFDVPDNFLLTHKNINLDFEKVFVQRVIDGDTIKVKFSNNRFAIVRLLGIDTPETKDPRKDIEFYGVEAFEFTKKNLENKEVYLEYDKSNLSGKYGRLLAYVYLDNKKNKNFNQILIQKGYARVYLKYPFKYEKYFLKSQIQAKKQKLGIWQNIKIKKQFLEEQKQEKYIQEKNNLFYIDKVKLIENEYKNLNKNTKQILDYNFKDFKNNIFKESWFKGKNISNNNLNINYLFKNYEKQLKKSIKYRVIKNKSSFKIIGYSTKYKKIIIEFQKNNYILDIDKDNKFILNLTKIKPGNYYINFYGIDENKNKILLKKSRKIFLPKEYVNNIGKLKKKGRKKKIKIIVNKKDGVLETTKNLISNDFSNKKQIINYIFDFKQYILKILIGVLLILFLFLVLIRKKLLQ